MARRLNDRIDVRQAIANSVGAVGALVATKINATGFSRARFVFSFGSNGGTTAALSAGIGVWQAATSGATFTAIAGGSMAAVTSGVLSNNVMVIDTVVAAATPWLQISGGSLLSTAIANSCIVELYGGASLPPSSSAQQIVVI